MTSIAIITRITLLILVFGISSCAVVKTNYNESAFRKSLSYYYLPKTTLEVKVNVTFDTVNNKIVERTFKVESKTVADKEELLTIDYAKNPFFSDEINVSIDENQMIQSIQTFTVDKTPEIIEKIAETVAQVVLPAAGTYDTGKAITKSKTFIIDPYTAKKNIWIEKINNVDYDFSFAFEGKMAPKSITELIPKNKNNKISGILTRANKNVVFEIKDERYKETSKRDEFKFKNGQLVSSKVENPSSALGFVSIPLNIVHAILAVPGNFLANIFGHDNKPDEQSQSNNTGTTEYRVTEDNKIKFLDIKKKNGSYVYYGPSGTMPYLNFQVLNKKLKKYEKDYVYHGSKENNYNTHALVFVCKTPECYETQLKEHRISSWGKYYDDEKKDMFTHKISNSDQAESRDYYAILLRFNQGFNEDDFLNQAKRVGKKITIKLSGSPGSHQPKIHSK